MLSERGVQVGGVLVKTFAKTDYYLRIVAGEEAVTRNPGKVQARSIRRDLIFITRVRFILLLRAAYERRNAR